jgi:hypothetical protein
VEVGSSGWGWRMERARGLIKGGKAQGEKTAREINRAVCVFAALDGAQGLVSDALIFLRCHSLDAKVAPERSRPHGQRGVMNLFHFPV